VLNVGVQSSEPDGFRAFVDASSRPLLRSAWLLTGDWAVAEDLVQTALAATWTHWSAARQAPAAYTRRVMTRTYLRWRGRRWTGELATADLPEQVDNDAADAVAARCDLQTALATLTPQQRAAVVARYFADLSEAETAAAMGCSVGAVKSHTARALARLRSLPGVAEILRGGVG
jgi:RNA polymerase sigma-70 factor (sigma-E family)